MKKVLVVLLACSMLFIFIGCGMTQNTDICSSGYSVVPEEEGDEEENDGPDVTMEQLDYSFGTSITDGQRHVSMKFTNNSDYILAEFAITFLAKSSVTDEQLESFYNDIYDEYSFDEETMAELKDTELTMNAMTTAVIEPGESIDIPVCYYEGSAYVLNEDHFDLVEPNVATIRYIKDGVVYGYYYDFLNDEYTYDDQDTADQWPSNGLSTLIPKPDSEYIETMTNTDTTFIAYAHGYSQDKFDAYVQQCKDLGYSTDTELDQLYTAYDDAGDEIIASYMDGELRISINKEES